MVYDSNQNNPDRAVVFAHYDPKGIVEEYVLYYLKALKKICSTLIVVSTAPLSKDEQQKIHDISDKLICRENIGYDFYSYKVGIKSLALKDYDEIIICNDSVYGPLSSIEECFLDMENTNCDFWGVTENYDTEYHLQSYFIAFRQPLITSNVFKEFWDDVEILDDKNEIIKKYEIGMTGVFKNNNFKYASYCKTPESNLFKVTYKAYDLYKFTRKVGLAVFINKLSSSKAYTSVDQDSNGVISKNLVSRFFEIIYKIMLLSINSLKPGDFHINPTYHLYRKIIKNQKCPFIKADLFRKNADLNSIAKRIEFLNKETAFDTDLIKSNLKNYNKSI
jgi:rhamnosyltransferase